MTVTVQYRQNIVSVYATRMILHNISGIAVDTLLVGYVQ